MDVPSYDEAYSDKSTASEFGRLATGTGEAALAVREIERENHVSRITYPVIRDA